MSDFHDEDDPDTPQALEDGVDLDDAGLVDDAQVADAFADAEPLRIHSSKPGSRGKRLTSSSTEESAGMTDDKLVTKLTDAYYQREFGLSFLHVAVATSSPSEFQQIVRDNGDYVNAIDNVDRTPIYFAILLGKLKTFKILIELGAMLNVQDVDGCTPAHWAAYNGQADMLQIIASKGVNLDIVDGEGRTPLHWASAHKSSKCTELLVKEKFVNVNATDDEQMAPLHWACFHGNSKHVRALVNGNADIHMKDIEGKTPLHWCSANKDASCAKILLAQPSVDVNACDNEGRTPLHMCVADNSKPVLSAIMKEKAVDVGIKDVTGRTALHWATAVGAHALIPLLSKSDAAFSGDSNGATPYHYGAQMTSPDSIKALIKGDKGAHIDAPDNDGRSALFWALAQDHVANAEVLLQGGADPNLKDSLGQTILQIMAADRLSSVQCLLRNKQTDPNFAEDEAKQPPLIIACNSSQPEIVRVILEARGDVKATDAAGRTALHSACISGSLACLRHLTSSPGSNAVLDAKDSRGETPLHYASFYGYTDCAAHLLNIGADPNARDNDGVSPLHWAASQGFSDVVQLLLENHAHPNFLDKAEEAQTPMDYAAAAGHEDIVVMLEGAQGAHGVVLMDYAAVRIQAWWRMVRAQRALKRMRDGEKHDAATLIQAAFRGYSQRKKFESMLDEHREEERKAKEAEEQKIREAEQLLSDEKRKLAEAERKQREEEEKKQKEEELREQQRQAQEKLKEQKRAEERRKQEEARRRQREKEEAERKKRLQELELLENGAPPQQIETSKEETLNILKSRRQRVQLVRSEQQRLTMLRKHVQAARTIQLWWRRCKHLENLRENADLDGNKSWHHGHKAMKPQLGSHREARRPPVALTDLSPRKEREARERVAEQKRRQTANLRPKEEYTREHLVAALTIQLWWRRYLAEKHTLMKPRRKMDVHDLSVAKKMQSKRIQAAYRDDPSVPPRQKKKKAVTSRYMDHYKPSPPRPVRTTLLPDVPPAVVMSWQSATKTYARMPQPRKKGTRRGAPKRASRGAVHRRQDNSGLGEDVVLPAISRGQRNSGYNYSNSSSPSNRRSSSDPYNQGAREKVVLPIL